jgi:hypothetical protein
LESARLSFSSSLKKPLRHRRRAGRTDPSRQNSGSSPGPALARTSSISRGTTSTSCRTSVSAPTRCGASRSTSPT